MFWADYTYAVVPIEHSWHVCDDWDDLSRHKALPCHCRCSTFGKAQLWLCKAGKAYYRWPDPTLYSFNVAKVYQVNARDWDLLKEELTLKTFRPWPPPLLQIQASTLSMRLMTVSRSVSWGAVTLDKSIECIERAKENQSELPYYNYRASARKFV